VRTSSIWTGSAKTDTQPLPLSRLACDVLKEWKKEQPSESPFVFPSPRSPGKPIHSVKRAWRTALKNAGVRISGASPTLPADRGASGGFLFEFARRLQTFARWNFLEISLFWLG
jgi:integrase